MYSFIFLFILLNVTILLTVENVGLKISKCYLVHSFHSGPDPKLQTKKRPIPVGLVTCVEIYGQLNEPLD